VFGPRTTVGLVRFYSTGAATQIAELLKLVQEHSQGFIFEGGDVGNAAIFADTTPAPVS
jgi:hypothetical protein